MRISLKPTTESDFEDYYMIRSSPGDIYWNGYETKPDKEQFRIGFLKRLGDAKFEEVEDRRNYLIQLKNDKLECISIGFVQLIKRNDGIDIGYTIIEDYQGNGYATEALNLGVELAKRINNSIYVQIRDDNIASQKVAQKCGFIKTNEYEIHYYPEVGSIPLRKYRLSKVNNVKKT